MKKAFSLIIGLFMAFFSKSQDFPVITQYYNVPFYYNPAEAGGGKVPTLSALYRVQWSKLQDNPTTSFIALDYPISDKLSSKLPWLNGAAGIIGYDEIGFLKRTTLDARFSGNIIKSVFRGLKVGVATRYKRVALNTDEFGLREFSDPEFIQRFGPNGKSGDFDLDLGFLYWRKNYRMGLTFQDFNDKFTTQEGVDSFDKVVGNTIWSFAYVYSNFPSNIEVIPHLLYRLSLAGKGQFDLRVNSTWKKKFTFSIGYRQGFGLNFGLGFRLDRLFVGYANDVTINDKIAGTGNTSEFLVQSALRKEKPYRSIVTKNTEVPDTTNIEVPDPLVENIHSDTLVTIIDLDIIEDEFQVLEKIGHVILEHIGFEKNSDILKPDAYDEIDKLVIYLNVHSNLHVQIEGHTDDTGSHEFNIDLSERRALAVNNYLVSRGIERDQLELIGYGETRPVALNDTEEGRELNRRIEIKLIDKERK